MSHFAVLVITRKKSKDSLDHKAEVEKLLSPYCEHDQAPAHPKECSCVGLSGKSKSFEIDWGEDGEASLDCEECEGSGIYLSTYNEASKWDWYEIGGRWQGELSENNSPDVEFVRDIRKEFEPFAFVTPDYEWHERARMGWWATTTDDNDGFAEEWKSALKTYNNHVAVLLDCHI